LERVPYERFRILQVGIELPPEDAVQQGKAC